MFLKLWRRKVKVGLSLFNKNRVKANLDSEVLCLLEIYFIYFLSISVIKDGY